MEDEIRILDVAAVPLRRWRLIAIFIALSILMGGALLIVGGDTYTAETTLVPVESESRFSLLPPELAEAIPFDLAGGGGLSKERDLTLEILESRTVRDTIIREFDLGSYYHVDTMKESRERLASATEIETSEDGSIDLRFSSNDPQLSARVANRYWQELNAVSARLGVDFAVQRTAYLRRQLALVERDLLQAEMRLVEFLRTNEAAEVPDQARQLIETTAMLQRRIIEQEMQVAQLRRMATPNNPRLQQALSELSAMRSQLRQLRFGNDSDQSLVQSLREIPQLGADYRSFLRDYEKNERIFLSLSAALAEAQMDAADLLPIVTVLDPAIVPTEPSGLHPLLLMALFCAAGAFLGLLAAFTTEWFANERREHDHEQFDEAWDRFKRQLTGRSGV